MTTKRSQRKIKSIQHHKRSKAKTSRKHKTHNPKLRSKSNNKKRKRGKQQKGGVMMGATSFETSTKFTPPPKPPFGGCTIM